MKYIGILSTCLFLFGCATSPQNNEIPFSKSAAYQSAVDNAFRDLETKVSERNPASTPDSQSFAAIKANFLKTNRFEVTVYPKYAALAANNHRVRPETTMGEPEKFAFRIDRQGKCALAGPLVPEALRSTCIQVEIKPHRKDRQFVRVFMNSDYRVYGISYHDYDSERDQIRRNRSMVKWDLNEPLSSDLLSLANEIVPLDLPIHASNSARVTDGTVTFKSNERSERSCAGTLFKYTNVYGSHIKAGWCVNDPWPSKVETSRYIAILNQSNEVQK